MDTYYKDGSLESHQSWKNGLRDGKQVFFYKNSNKKIEVYLYNPHVQSPTGRKRLHRLVLSP